VLGRSIYLAAYGFGLVASYVKQHVSEGLAAARSHMEGSQRISETPPMAPVPNADVTEHLVIELESVILEMIAAAKRNDFLKLREIDEKQQVIFQTLQQEGNWDSERIVQYLTSRGSVDLDGQVFQDARKKVQEAKRRMAA
jgi:hypothetical protein